MGIFIEQEFFSILQKLQHCPKLRIEIFSFGDLSHKRTCFIMEESLW
jgi:hypothetical protein